MSITKRSRSDNVIPDYEYLFSEDGTVSSDKKKKNNLIAKVFRPYLPVILFSLVLYVIKASPVWIMPIITANIINIASAGVFSETVTQQLILNSAILAIALLQNVPMHVWYSKLTDKILRNTGAGIRAVVIRKLQHLSITYHKQIETGEIQSKFLRDIESVENLLTNILKFIVPNIIGVLISTGIALYTNRIVTLFFVVVIPLNIVLTRAFSGKLKRGNREYRVAHESMSVRLSNMLEMLTVTKAHGLEEEEIHRFEDSIKSLTTKGLAVDKTNAYFGSWAWVIGNLLSGSCLIFCAVLALNGKIKAGDIVLYQSLFGSINGSIQNLINNVPQISVGREAVSSLEEILRSHEIENNSNKEKLNSLEGNVEFCNVSYTYPNAEQKVIDDFNLTVSHGECIAVVGASGSGKSTIMNLLIGFLQPNIGKVLIDGKDLSSLSLPEYRRFISVVPQNSILFGGTIRENITYGLSSYKEEELQRVVEMANINEFLGELPKGIDTPIGENGGKLSGGQKQRITIARALIRDPKILILDEATSALDNLSEFHVQRAIAKSVKGRTTFIVAHRLSTIRDADRIVVMDGGKCVEMGSYEELMNKKGRFFELKTLSDMSYHQADSELGD